MLIIRDLRQNHHQAKASPDPKTWQRHLRKEASKILKQLSLHHKRKTTEVTLVFMDNEALDDIYKSFGEEGEDPLHSSSLPSQEEEEDPSRREILTFSYHEKASDPIEGDILIAPERLFALADEEGMPRSYILMETALHGMLHLHGLTHRYDSDDIKRVRLLQQRILNTATINWRSIDELVPFI